MRADRGYKGVETCELTFDDYRVPASAILGGEPGKGFGQMMKSLETGRIQVAFPGARGCTAALEDALRYARSGRASTSRSGNIRRSATIWPTWRPWVAQPVLTSPALSGGAVGPTPSSV